jgi:hypothetical protein
MQWRRHAYSIKKMRPERMDFPFPSMINTK